MNAKADIKTGLGIVRNDYRRKLNNRVWGAGAAIFDPEIEHVLLLKSRHNKVHELPGGGVRIFGRLIERTFRSFQDDRGVYSISEMHRTAAKELEEETGLTEDLLQAPLALVDTYYGNKPRDTYTVFAAVTKAHIAIEELNLQEDEVDTSGSSPGAVWQPINRINDLGPLHFVLNDGAVLDAARVLDSQYIARAA